MIFMHQVVYVIHSYIFQVHTTFFVKTHIYIYIYIYTFYPRFTAGRKNLKIKEINNSLVSKHAPSENGP
jgi:hypothetical protein